MTEISSAMNASQERKSGGYNGFVMLAVATALTGAMIWAIGSAIYAKETGQPAGMWLGTAGFFLVVGFLSWCGFYMIQPNQGAVITLFGEYRGTDRTEGLRWVWPWMGRKKVSVRAHNVHSERIKINDKRGNPIDVACNVVWRVRDTAQAVFDVDDYKEFVNIQIEAGLRTVGARHPYDDFEENETTLRGHPDVVNSELQAELNDRLKVAGIVVDEAGLTHLAYASEIAGAMLRRQQADAVIAARKKVVLGAVGMVEDALQKLASDDIVHLDDERRAAMVSNLLVVLCGDRETQPVVNAGSLYQ
ncbi:SPFH domain-containing protein [Aurantiacibacter sp. MUD61]|uniref:SPFH domain-containing protein n=1 Tax=Aurantiacibacter sp. MUD61 TaxID=3009083 RepID=UPI0022EFEE74|nr:SPFH domain-containing protein [Aurantiacibacter sp. MUD61]